MLLRREFTCDTLPAITADAPGVLEVELEEAGLKLFELQVQ